MWRHGPFFGYRPGHPKITYGDFAGAINQNIRWFQVSMNNISTMDKIETAQHIVQHDQNMGVRELSVGGAEQLLKVRQIKRHHQEDA